MSQSHQGPFPVRRAATTAALAAITSAVALLSSACASPSGDGVQGAASAPSAAAPAPSALTPMQRMARQDRAAALYRAECAGCHGERGRGDGPAATFLSIKPRNFLQEKFKVRTTAGGTAPVREDIFATITRGMPGSAMPPFKFLTEEERWLLTDHVWSLANLDAKKPGKVMPATKETPSDAESIKRGRAIYERFECGKCHGDQGKADGPSSKTLKDDLERPILARDLTRDPFRGGDTAEAVNLRFRTGMDGTPMPSYADSVKPEEAWDLTHYVVSLRAPKDPPPSDAVAYGRKVIEEKQCQGCHVIEGQGARVGPNLDTSAQKLQYAWAKGFLKDPRSYGKIYPYIPYRMPDLGLTDAEIDAVLAVFAKVANRTYPDQPEAAATIDAAKVNEGQLLYFLKCTECHNLGKVIPNPVAKQQGPDLIDVTKRMRFEFMPRWVKAPQDVNPDARMVDTNLTEDQVAAVTAFVWKTSLDAQTKAAAAPAK
ncbi:MAG: c-type cytochrome [Polyangiaceae bacterium]|nr:c-type cytochrome [Polyangiaceae bacterium]